MQLTEPLDVFVVSAAHVAPADVPKRSSLPSRFPSDWSTGSATTLGKSRVRASRLRGIRYRVGGVGMCRNAPD